MTVNTPFSSGWMYPTPSCSRNSCIYLICMDCVGERLDIAAFFFPAFTISSLRDASSLIDVFIKHRSETLCESVKAEDWTIGPVLCTTEA